MLACDFYAVKRRVLDIDALYSLDPGGEYYYSGGTNPAAVTAVLVGMLPSLPGLYGELTGAAVPAICSSIYEATLFVGAPLGAAVYGALMIYARKRANCSTGDGGHPVPASP